MSTISELTVKIGADSSGLSSSLNQAKTDINKTFDINPISNMNNAINGLNNSVTGLIGKFNGLVGLAATGFGFTSLVEDAVNAGAGIYQMSQTLHTSAAEAAEFNRILKLSGVETHSAETAFVRLDKTLTESGEAGNKCRAAFKAVGVSMTDQNGKLLPINQQLEQLATGYQKASAAGMGQEFIMNTVGARGMELVKILKNYNEIKENSAKVQGIGLDPEEMYKMQQQLRLLQMQAGQLKLVFGSVFVNLMGDNVEKISSGLASIAKYIAENRQQITALTGEVVKFLAAYEAIKVVSSVGNSMMGAWNSHSARADLNAINTTQEAALTAQQERSIMKRQAMIEAAAKKEEAAYYKTIQSMELAESEKTAIFTEYLLKREQASLESQAAIRTSMTEMYLQANVAAEESATAQAAAMNNVAVTAEETAARVAAANAAQAESSAAVIVAEEEKAATMVEAGEVGVVAAEETTAANMALSEAEIAAGSAATVASEQAVAGATAATVATGESTLATTELTEATALAGAEAEMTGGKTVGACAVATTATKALTFAVSLLRSQWLLVAMATYEAISALVAYNKAKAEETQSNDGVDYEANGKHYALKNGEFYEVTENTETYSTDELGAHTQTTRSISDTPLDHSTEDYSKVIADYNSGHGNDADVVAMYKQQELEAEQERLKESLQDAMNGNGGGAGGGNGGGTTASPKAAMHEIKTPVGDVAAEVAASHPDGEQWMGNVTSDPSIQCDSFTANVYNQAGISSIGGVDTSSSTINDSAFRAAGAYHAVGDGYVPQNGDLVDFANHVGIYKDGYVISRQSSAGVHTVSMAEAESYFGKVQGYGSIAEATGGQTVTRTVDAEGKEMEDAAAKLAKAKEDAYKLFNVMSNKILEENGTAYETGMNKVDDDVQAKQQQINKLKTAGLDVSVLEKELDLYKKALDKKVVEKWHEAWYKIKDDTRQALDAITYNYEDAANIQYTTQQRALEKEKKERLKDIQQTSKDKIAVLAVEKWYNTELLKLQDERNKAVRESHDKYLKSLANDGNYLKVITDLKYHPDKRQDDMNIKGQKEIAEEYIKIWDAAHTTIAANISSVTDALYGSLTDSIQGFVSGTKGAMDVVHDFGNTIIKEMERIAAQQLAGQILSTMMGSFFTSPTKGMNHSLTTSTYQKFMPNTDFLASSKTATTGYKFSVPAFSSGGIVTAPTLGLIGETHKREAVIPLTDSNLKAMGGGKSSGGVVVNINNNSDSKPRVASSRYDERLNKTVLDIVIDGASRNVGGFGTNLKTALK